MTGQEELIMFARIRASGGNQLEEWMAEKEASAVKTMAAGDGVVMHRAQGRYLFLDEIKKLLDASKNAR